METITKIFPLQYARVKGYELVSSNVSSGTGIKDVMEKLITTYGNVVEDSRSNSLVITDLPTQFEIIERAIEELDIKLPQVMIEAEIIETSVDLIDKLGIAWGSSGGDFASAFGAARSATFPFTKPQGMGKVGADGAPMSLYTGYISATNLGGTLTMLKTDTDTRTLARPRILTLNNETAEINITAETAVASLTTTTASEGISTSIISAERVETGISLKVTPQINKKGEITMGIEPSVVNTKASSFFPGTFVDPQTRSAKTTVTVFDGQTIVIGGLINTEDSKSLRKVPWFSDIPLVGNLFRKKNDTTLDKELIIFITPHLVDSGIAAEKGLVMEKQIPWEYGNLGLKEEAMDRFLDRHEE